ncbi:MAG: MFS transporter, partial [Phycisphaerales bacterium]
MTRATVTIAAHFMVDVFSFVGVSLLPLLAVTLDLRTEQKALLLALGSLCSGAVQPVVAWASDRYDTRAIGTAGMLVAVLCISSLGLADSFGMLALLFCLGAAGVGAFHPPAAATVGRLGGANRSKYIAFFFLAGMVGGMVGNLTIPRFVAVMTPMTENGPATEVGLRSLLWFIPIGLLGAYFLARSIHPVGHRHHGDGERHVSWDRAERRRRWGAVWILYIANTMRFSVNMALVYLLVEWTGEVVMLKNDAAAMTDTLGLKASQLNGVLQASMQVGMGGMGIVLGLVLAARYEKLVFVALPMLGSIALFMIPRTAMISESLMVPFAIFATVLTGVGFGAVIPVSISLAQRLLPHRTSLASGLMLGGAWMLAFVGPLLAELVHKGLDEKPNTPPGLIRALGSLPDSVSTPLIEGLGLTAGFTVMAAVLFFAGLIALLLPAVQQAREAARRTQC